MVRRLQELGLLRAVAKYLEVRGRGREVSIKPRASYASTLEFGGRASPPVRIFDNRKPRAKRSR